MRAERLRLIRGLLQERINLVDSQLGALGQDAADDNDQDVDDAVA
jgi:hypothetical protein